MDTAGLIVGVERRVFAHPKTPKEYGYRDGRPILQEGSPSGYLLPWEVLDDEADAMVAGRPSMYCITGEAQVGDIRYPFLAVTNAYMCWAGFLRENHRWVRQNYDR